MILQKISKKLKEQLKLARVVRCSGISISNTEPLVLISGPCVIENKSHTLKIAKKLKEITKRLKIPLIFKASYDKANRSSIYSYRGPGLDKGLDILQSVKEKLNIPVLSDVHNTNEVEPASGVLDIIQIPALLCRQTDLIVEVAKTKKPINVKKGQFMSPWEMKNIIEKIKKQGNEKILLTERGTTFGYNNLVVDMRSIYEMKKFSYPVIFDATHSVQLPGALGKISGGNKEHILPLAKAATAIGIAALYIEVHDNPKKALCDGIIATDLKDLPNILKKIKAIDNLVKSN